MTEFILNSNEHKINDNTLIFNFKKPIRFINSNISLTSMIFYNYLPNIDENYKLYVNYNNQTTIINFSKGAYNINDINDITNLKLNENYDFREDKIDIIIDVNQYSILIILEGFTIILGGSNPIFAHPQILISMYLAQKWGKMCKNGAKVYGKRGKKYSF